MAESDDYPECDFNRSRPLDQVVREAEGQQYELFPELMDEHEKKIVRRLKRIIDWF